MIVSYLLCSSHFFEAVLVFSKNLNSFSLPIFVLNRYSIDFWSLMERLLPEMGCSVQPKAYSPTSYLSGRKAPHRLIEKELWENRFLKKIVYSWKNSELESTESCEKTSRPQPNSVFA